MCVIFLNCILLSQIVHESRLNADGKIFLVCTPVSQSKNERPSTVIWQFAGWKTNKAWGQVCKLNCKSRLSSWTGLRSKRKYLKLFLQNSLLQRWQWVGWTHESGLIVLTRAGNNLYLVTKTNGFLHLKL